jgi:hypothetical protein
MNGRFIIYIVVNILNEKSNKPHRLTPWAKIGGAQFTYPQDEEIKE